MSNSVVTDSFKGFLIGFILFYSYFFGLETLLFVSACLDLGWFFSYLVWAYFFSGFTGFSFFSTYLLFSSLPSYFSLDNLSLILSGGSLASWGLSFLNFCYYFDVLLFFWGGRGRDSFLGCSFTGDSSFLDGLIGERLGDAFFCSFLNTAMFTLFVDFASSFSNANLIG